MSDEQEGRKKKREPCAITAKQENEISGRDRKAGLENTEKVTQGAKSKKKHSKAKYKFH